MAQFIALNNEVEVNQQTVFSIVNSMELGKDVRLKILNNNGIHVGSQEWFNQQDWLNAFKQVSEVLGEMNLFLIGKAIIDHAKFPPINSLEEGLRSIDIAYHMNHRIDGNVMYDGANGKMLDGIGHYHLKSYDEEQRKAVMVCDNPYPSKFDEGIITQIVRKFKPNDSRSQFVNLDPEKETRLNGGNSCTYNISW